MSSKLYFRLLILFVAMLAIAQMGWGLYFLTPERKPKPPPAYLNIRGFSSPTFKYKYAELSADELKADWREVDCPEGIGRKILNLLRGSKSKALVLAEYDRQYPGKRRWPQLFNPNSVGVLTVFENGSDQPVLTLDFQASGEVIVIRRGGDSDLFVIPPEKYVEIDNLTAAIQWGRILEDE